MCVCVCVCEYAYISMCGQLTMRLKSISIYTIHINEFKRYLFSTRSKSLI